MAENKTLHLAVLVSILAHSVLFLSAPNIPFLPSKRSLGKLNITYYKIKEIVKKEKVATNREPIIRELPKITKEEILKPPKTAAKNLKEPQPTPRRTTSAENTKEKTFAKVVEVEQDDAKNATYISYYKAVREKIRQRADKNYPKNRKLAEGEVFLSFVVASSGELLQVKVVNEKSSQSRFLRNIAINSIRDASPFPAFPKGMRSYQITFNVIISFELNK